MSAVHRTFRFGESRRGRGRSVAEFPVATGENLERVHDIGLAELFESSPALLPHADQTVQVAPVE